MQFHNHVWFLNHGKLYHINGEKIVKISKSGEEERNKNNFFVVDNKLVVLSESLSKLIGKSDVENALEHFKGHNAAAALVYRAINHLKFKKEDLYAMVIALPKVEASV